MRMGQEEGSMTGLKILVMILLAGSLLACSKVDIDFLEKVTAPPGAEGAVENAPVAVAITPANFNEDTESLMTLVYSDADSDLAATCSISGPTNVTETTACSCTAGGVCTVGVTGNLGFVGSGESFNFRVTANSAVSNDSSAQLTISEVVNPFVSTWATTATNESIRLPLSSGFSYNFKVDWGDGSQDRITIFNQTEASHSYAATGNHTVTIWGVAPAWSFNDTGDKDKITSVEHFGDLGWTDLSGAFWGCSNLTSFAGGNTAAVRNMGSMFNGASALTKLNAMNWSLAGAPDFTDLFLGTNSLEVYCNQGGLPGTGTLFGENCVAADFISLWRTTAANETVTLPLQPGFSYNFEINWGDSALSTIITTADIGSGKETHSYVNPGEHIVTISGGGADGNI
jgi:hypothetical protein